MSTRSIYLLLLLLGWSPLAFGLLAGCQAVAPASDAALESLLKPAKSSPDSVTLEIVQARVPLDQQEQAEAMWRQIDEMRLPADLRRRLTANGFRVGVAGQSAPKDLAELLSPSDAAADPAAAQLITQRTASPQAVRRIVQVRRGEPAQIEAAEPAAELNVLYCDQSGLTGAAFSRAQPIYQVQASAAPGQRVKLELLPELHHGDVRNRYVGSDGGIFLVTPSQERKAYPQLRTEIELAPGETLVLGCLDEASASLGQAFHTAGGSGAEQRKLIAIRMVQVPPSEILANQ